MANPTLYNLNADTWTLVATSVAVGQLQLHRVGSSCSYLVTYRETGGSAPTNTEDVSAMPFSFDTEPKGVSTPPLINIAIDHPTNIDVYVKTQNGAGKVVVAI